METWAWRIAAGVGAASLPVMVLLPSGAALDIAWVVLTSAALVSTWLGPRLHPPANRGPHRLLLVAFAATVAAASLEVSWWATSLDGPAATAASVLYLVSFVFLAVAMFRFVAHRMPTGDAEGLIDGGLVAIAAAAVLYDVLTKAAVTDSYSDTGAVALVLLPLLMAGVIASIVRVLLAGAHRLPTIWFFLAAATCSIVANVQSMAHAEPTADPAVRLLFALAYVLFICGTLHPSSARLSEPAPRGGARLAYGRLTVIAAALASLPTVMLMHLEAGSSPVPGVAAIVCVGLVVWRIARLLLDRERAVEASERRTEREIALSAIGHAAVTTTGPLGFVDQVTAAIDRTLQASTSITTDDRLPGDILIPLDASSAAMHISYPNGKAPTDEDRRFARTAADLTDAALRRWEVEEQLRHGNLHDNLTGLPNRAAVSDRLASSIATANEAGGQLVVLFIDLDGFKRVNDTLGHAAGDELLNEVARRLRAEVRPDDMVGRLAGDEFVVVCESAAPSTTTLLAQRLLHALQVPFALDLGDAIIGASIGVASAEPGDDPERLLHRADAAMYQAKNAGKGRITHWQEHAVT